MVAVVVVVALASRAVPRLRHGRAVQAIVAIVAGIGLLVYPLIAIWYASDPHFYDNAEPTIVSVAWIYLKGAPLYHAIDAPERYSHIYGPMAFMVHAWALAALGPSIGVSKWLGAAAGIASVVLIYATLRRVCSRDRAIALTGISTMMLLAFRHYSFWTRPDPLQLFCAALSLFCASGRGGPASIVVAGLASGILWNLKITGVLYSLPVLVLIAQRAGARAASIAIAIGLVVAIAPFSLDNISITNYLTWLRLSGQTGLLFSLLLQNLEWAVYLCLPMVLARSMTERTSNDDRQLVGALTLGILIVVVAASKPGAGPYHLIPFVPAIIFLAGTRLGAQPLLASRVLAPAAAIAWSVALVLLAANQGAMLVTAMTPRRALDDVEDVRAFLAGHEGIVEMGYGWTEAKSLIRPVVTFRNHSYLIDQPAVREYQLQGLDLPSSTIDAVRGCRAAYWLIPKGEQPFSAINSYPSVAKKPLYPPAFQAAFAATYRLTETTKHYDVWTCAGARQ